MHKDKNDIQLKPGDIINLHQAVNGENVFYCLEIDPLDIRYGHDITYKYEYDKESMLAPCKYT